MPLKRNDRHDIDRRELKLIRVGHYLWSLYKKECGKSGNVGEQTALQTALEIVWGRKAELRETLKADRAAKAETIREHFKKVAASAK